MKDTMQVDAKDAQKYFDAMTEFQFTHNELRKDFNSIYEIVGNLDEMSSSYKPLLRASLKELFSLIEADLYLYNQYNAYTNYFDKEAFSDKFKKTFKRHGRTFNRMPDVLSFNSLNFELFNELKAKRDKITHPKGLADLHVDRNDLASIYKFYVLYTDHVNNLMTGTSFSYTMPIRDILAWKSQL
ncbi:hypothetical protein [Pedobacter sp. Hv1]|uniref:hypothetical protein n=1 Tax=Pedobacter sp. Hv1 TaxID=1740090 RepID=UPI0006D8A0EE|nr:hypothetical protein [Pedobacter sp. Hv1]KQC02364.1 hypothetical protein AQF98_01945 [Pedobacter sp. Hv1]